MRKPRAAAALAACTALLFLLCGCGGQSGGTGVVGQAQSETAETAQQPETETAETARQSETETAEAAKQSETETASPYLPEGTALQVLGFSAGKADAFLLTTAHGAVLIDCGEKGFGKTILAELEARDITKLDYLILTHFDQDHVGGAAKVLNNFPVETVLQSNQPKDSGEYGKYVNALNKAGIEAVTVRDTLDFTLDGVSFHVDPPRRDSYRNDDSNNSSLIVTVTAGDETGGGNLLFLGDAETERLDEFLDWNSDAWDVVKMPHHGRADPLTAALLDEVRPKYAVITSSEEEPEDRSVLDALDAAGAETFLTRTGEVLISVGDGGVEIGYR